jgi:putative ABC transport system permease protein
MMPTKARRLADAGYALLLRSFPRRHRERYGREMLDAFREQGESVARSSGRMRAFTWILAAYGDVAAAGWQMRRRERERTREMERMKYDEGSRVATLLGGLSLDVRYVLRGLRRSPALFGIALLTIALGVGANTAMFSIVRGVLLRPLPYAESERLTALWPEKRWSITMLEDVRERITSFDGIAASTGANYTLMSGDAPPEALIVAIVTPGYFDVLGVRAWAGRTFMEGDEVAADGYVVMLGYDFWQARFGGDPDVIGRTIDLGGGGTQSRTVVGILPPEFTPPMGSPQVWAPVITQSGMPGYYGSYGMRVLGRLRPGVTAAQASAELRTLVPELTPLHPTQFRDIRYSPVDVVPLLDTIVRDVRPKLLILMGVVGFILLIAASNVANLLLARAAGRQRDVGLQMALGSSRRRVARQVLMESTLLGVLGGLAGAASALLALPLIRRYVAEQLPRDSAIVVDPAVLLFALGLSLLAGLIFGAIPALRAMQQEPAALLRESSRGSSQGRRGGRANDALVVAEVALSLVLLAGAGLMLKSLSQLTAVDIGFDAADVTTMQISVPAGSYPDPEARGVLWNALLERAQAVPGVTAAGAISDLPLGGSSSGVPYTVEGQPVPEGASFQVVSERAVTPGYFDVMRIPLVRGSMLDGQVPEQLLVNETFAAQHWPGEDPVGRRVLETTGEEFGVIVGVVGDIRQMDVSERPAAEIYYHAAAGGWGNSFMTVRGAGVAPQTIVSALREVEPLLTVQRLRTMPEVVRANLGDAHFFARLFVGFAALALVLAMIGVYGVMSYGISQRMREIGVRIALGATAPIVLRGVLTRALLPVAIGIAVGTVIALISMRIMSSLLYEVSTGDPWVLAGVALLMGVVGAAGAIIPATRALRVDPLTVLRGD